MSPGWKDYPKDFDGEVWGLAKSLMMRAYAKSPVRWKWLIKYLGKSKKRFAWTNRVADEIRIRKRTFWEWFLFEKPIWKSEFQPAPERLDKLFCMDQIDHLKSIDVMKVFTREEFIDKVNERNIPVVMSYRDDRVKKCEEYPLQDVHDKFGPMYFTNSICFMIAYALHKGVTELEFWGVMQGGRLEYLRERRGVEYWLGMAVGQGVKVSINSQSLLLSHDDGNKVYGYKKTPQQLEFELQVICQLNKKKK